MNEFAINWIKGAEECPEGHPYCTGDCFYYSEDPEEKIAKGEEHWDLE